MHIGRCGSEAERTSAETLHGTPPIISPLTTRTHLQREQSAGEARGESSQAERAGEERGESSALGRQA